MREQMNTGSKKWGENWKSDEKRQSRRATARVKWMVVSWLEFWFSHTNASEDQSDRRECSLLVWRVRAHNTPNTIQRYSQFAHKIRAQRARGMCNVRFAQVFVLLMEWKIQLWREGVGATMNRSELNNVNNELCHTLANSNNWKFYRNNSIRWNENLKHAMKMVCWR